MSNIILIGMPGCGKTTIGRIISKDLSKNFLDVDEYIENRNSKTIDEMFSYGEEYFRNKETEAIQSITKVKNTIIATGGGVVKKEKNMYLLKQCGYIVFIHREPEKILTSVDISSRPLLQKDKNKIFQLYKERYDLYKKYCDLEINNNGDMEETVMKLKEIIKKLE